MEKSQTIRKQLMDLLSQEEMTARDLSKLGGVREKEVYEHLEHIARTVSGQGKKLVVRAPRCLSCGYVFKDRRRLTRPSRCPRCRDTHLDPPAYRIE